MRHYLAICEEWKKRPPGRWLKAAELKYQPPKDFLQHAGDGTLKLKPVAPRSPEAEARRLAIIAEAKARGETVVDDGGTPKADGASWLKAHGGQWAG